LRGTVPRMQHRPVAESHSILHATDLSDPRPEFLETGGVAGHPCHPYLPGTARKKRDDGGE
jgi:hypothetical protein